MKIVGKSEQGYLIAASESEITNLFGFSSEYNDEWKALLKSEKRDAGTYHGKNLIGLEIHPGRAYEQLAWIRRRNGEFDELCSKLRKTAGAIDDHRPLFTKIVGDGEPR